MVERLSWGKKQKGRERGIGARLDWRSPCRSRSLAGLSLPVRSRGRPLGWSLLEGKVEACSEAKPAGTNQESICCLTSFSRFLSLFVSFSGFTFLFCTLRFYLKQSGIFVYSTLRKHSTFETGNKDLFFAILILFWAYVSMASKDQSLHLTKDKV